MKGIRIVTIGTLLLLLLSCRGPEYLAAKSTGETEVAVELDKLVTGIDRKLNLTEQLFRTIRVNGEPDETLLTAFRKAKANFGEASMRDENGLLSRKNMKRMLAVDKSTTRIVDSLDVASATSETITTSRSYGALMNQLEGLDNRMKVIRADYNDALERNRRYVKLPKTE